MAYRRVALPVMKLTRRPATGDKSLKYIHGDIPFHPQREKVEETSTDRGDTEKDEAGDVDVDSLLFGMPDETEELTQHELESRAAMAGWEKIREDLINVVTEYAAMPLGQVCKCFPWYWFTDEIIQVCLNCKGSACVRCRDCGPLGYFCSGCFENAHRYVNLFHVGEKWEVRHL